jgi:hypothetical protein
MFCLFVVFACVVFVLVYCKVVCGILFRFGEEFFANVMFVLVFFCGIFVLFAKVVEFLVKSLTFKIRRHDRRGSLCYSSCAIQKGRQ